jgi:hypothetical protein
MRKLAISCVFLCAILVSAKSYSSDDAALITQLKKLSVSKLDPALPAVRFDQWLRAEAGSDARYQWEVNDCGEQTGAPGQNPYEIPTCVDADAWLKDGREIVIMIAVTRSAAAPGQKQSLTVVYFAQLITTRERITIKQLSDFPAALVRTHEPPSNPEIAK